MSTLIIFQLTTKLDKWKVQRYGKNNQEKKDADVKNKSKHTQFRLMSFIQNAASLHQQIKNITHFNKFSVEYCQFFLEFC